MLELNRLLRPGGYFVWSATPVYQKLPEDVEIWNGIALTAEFSFTLTECHISKLHTITLRSVDP